MKTKITGITEIISIDTKNFNAVFLFTDNTVKTVAFPELEHTVWLDRILKPAVFKTMTKAGRGIMFKHESVKIELTGDYYGIGGDILYLNAKDTTIPANELIRLLRKQKNLSQADLAQLTTVNTRNISLLEQGKTTNITLLRKIFSALM